MFFLISDIIFSFMGMPNFDELAKSRHSGENRSPDGLQLLEKTCLRAPHRQAGFRLSPE
jgi:hypothetical protein